MPANSSSLFEQLGFGKKSFSGGNESLAMTRPIASSEMEIAWKFYTSDPTITACRNVINGSFQTVKVRVSDDVTESDLELTYAFKRYIEKTWKPLIQPALDNIRVLGVVPYVVRRSSKKPPLVEILPPGSYNMTVALTDDLQALVSCEPSMSMTKQRISVFVNAYPNLDGTLRSPISSLVQSKERCDAMLKAAVEDQLARARPPIITQERRAQNASGETGAAALQDLNLFMGAGETGNVLSTRVDANDSARAAQLSAQVQRAAQLNTGVNEPIGNQTDAGTLAHNALLALPAGQEMAPNRTHAPLTQNVIEHRFALEKQICAVMGVPMPLLNPGESSYKQDEIVERIVNNELLRMESILSDFLTDVYQSSFADGSDKNSPNQDVINAASHRVHITFPRHVKFENVRDMYDREMFDAKYLGEMALQSQGLDMHGVTPKKYKVTETNTSTNPTNKQGGASSSKTN